MVSPSLLALALGILFVALLLTANWLIWELPYAANHRRNHEKLDAAAAHEEEHGGFKHVA